MQIRRKPDPVKQRNQRDDGEVVAAAAVVVVVAAVVAAAGDGGGGAETKKSNWSNRNTTDRGIETGIAVAVVAAAAAAAAAAVVVVEGADGGCSSSWPAGTILGYCLLRLRSCSSCLRCRNCCLRLRTAGFLNMQITLGSHMQMSCLGLLLLPLPPPPPPSPPSRLTSTPQCGKLIGFVSIPIIGIR